jgi:hypothetical protein
MGSLPQGALPQGVSPQGVSPQPIPGRLGFSGQIRANSSINLQTEPDEPQINPWMRRR